MAGLSPSNLERNSLRVTGVVDDQEPQASSSSEQVPDVATAPVFLAARTGSPDVRDERRALLETL